MTIEDSRIVLGMDMSCMPKDMDNKHSYKSNNRAPTKDPCPLGPSKGWAETHMVLLRSAQTLCFLILGACGPVAVGFDRQG